VIADITGETGMAIIRALLDGRHDPVDLAKLRHYRCQSSEEEIAESLRGTLRPEHMFVLRQSIALYDAHIAQLAACDAQIKKTLDALAAAAEPPTAPRPKRKIQAPKGRQPTFTIRDPLERITGVDLTQLHAIAPLTALNIVAEIGTDMRRWPTVKHFSSWLNLSPGTKITGGKRLSGRRRRATNRVANHLRLAAVTVGRTNTAIGAFYRRMAARLGKAKAVVATAHKLARVIYRLLADGVNFQDAGADAYEQRYKTRVELNLKRKAAAFGYQLVPLEKPAPEVVVT
jgi:transposase